VDCDDRFERRNVDAGRRLRLRQHERASVADRAILNRAKQFLAEGEATQSSHCLAIANPDRRCKAAGRAGCGMPTRL